MDMAMQVKPTAGTGSAALGVIGTGLAMTLPDQRWIGVILIMLGCIIFIFDIKVKGRRVAFGNPKGRHVNHWGPWLLIVGGPLLGVLWLYVTHSETTVAPSSLPSLPITITELKQPDAQIHSGLWPQNLREKDPPMFVIWNVYISNSSMTRTVTLRIFLVPWTKQHEDRRGNIEGTGVSPWHALMGRDDESAIRDKEHGLESTKYILSPVTIQPQTTVFGNLVFIMPLGTDVSTDIGKEVWGNILRGLSPNGVIIGNEPATDENKLNFLLDVTDVISNTSITIPVPGPGYHGQ
jgi:hypothetical protein